MLRIIGIPYPGQDFRSFNLPDAQNASEPGEVWLNTLSDRHLC